MAVGRLELEYGVVALLVGQVLEIVLQDLVFRDLRVALECDPGNPVDQRVVRLRDGSRSICASVAGGGA